MASDQVLLFQLALLCSFFLLAAPSNISFGVPLPDIRRLRSCNIDKIYQFGASKSDTGNRKIESPLYKCNRHPYGESYFLHPTGRCSDGLLTIDYIASEAGLPFINPYLEANANFRHGVNFAVAGSTALSVNALAQKNITLSQTNSSLGVQIEWMSDHFASSCSSDIDCRTERLKDAIFIVGESGYNDYYYALDQGKSIEEAQVMVPEVVRSIMDAVRKVCSIGAVRVIVPGGFPMGCLPVLLTMFQNSSSSAYDENQCLKGLNDLTTVHNNYLQKGIRRLQVEYPNTTIVYGDYYNAYKWILNNTQHIGFDASCALKACCGTGGNYNFAASKRCGTSIVPVCPDPDRYINWDGTHLTQKAQRVVATLLAADIISKLGCNLQVSDY